jgi:hypothetical protein
MSPFGSSTRDAGEERLLDQDDREPGLAGAGHAQDHAVGRQVARPDDQPVSAGLARLQVEGEAEVEVRHGASLKPAWASADRLVPTWSFVKQPICLGRPHVG